MILKRISGLTAGLVILGMIGCDTEDTRVIEREREIYTEPTMETVEIERMAEDTFMVERTTEVSVDTVEVEGATRSDTSGEGASAESHSGMDYNGRSF